MSVLVAYQLLVSGAAVCVLPAALTPAPSPLVPATAVVLVDALELLRELLEFDATRQAMQQVRGCSRWPQQRPPRTLLAMTSPADSSLRRPPALWRQAGLAEQLSQGLRSGQTPKGAQAAAAALRDALLRQPPTAAAAT